MARSVPLAVGKDGEPTVLPATAEKYEPWKVVIVDPETGRRRSKKFFSYKEAKQVSAVLKEKYGITARVAVVSRQMGYGPPYSKVSDRMLLDQNEMGNYWCPYCRAFRRFIYNAWRERHICEVCGTVDTDWHVIANNPIFWSTDKIERLVD